MTALDAAERFLAAHARILERRRFAHLVRGGAAAPVRDAVAAYGNPDGGFGHALEPDGRGPGSQPIAAATALAVLDAADVWDEALVAGACDWLEATAPAEGGATFVLPDAQAWPHAPWWRPMEGLGPSRTTTGQIVAPLLRRGVEHPWVERASAWLWTQVDDPGEPAPGPGAGYDALGLLTFLNAVPEADRAEAALDRLGPFVARVVKRDPSSREELQSPLTLAPRPDDRARRLFDDPQIAAFLDALDAGQGDDGGWTFDWPVWSAAAEADWRGVVTVEAVRVLQLNGRR